MIRKYLHMWYSRGKIQPPSYKQLDGVATALREALIVMEYYKTLERAQEAELLAYLKLNAPLTASEVTAFKGLKRATMWLRKWE